MHGRDVESVRMKPRNKKPTKEKQIFEPQLEVLMLKKEGSKQPLQAKPPQSK